MCLLGKGEITVFAQNGAKRRFGETPNWTPFLGPRQGDLAQILGSEPAYDLVQNFVAQMIILFKILFFIF